MFVVAVVCCFFFLFCPCFMFFSLDVYVCVCVFVLYSCTYRGFFCLPVVYVYSRIKHFFIQAIIKRFWLLQSQRHYTVYLALAPKPACSVCEQKIENKIQEKKPSKKNLIKNLYATAVLNFTVFLWAIQLRGITYRKVVTDEMIFYRQLPYMCMKYSQQM